MCRQLTYDLLRLQILLGNFMFSLAFLGIMGITSIWVYWDASAKGISSADLKTGRSQYSAIYWAIATLFLWPFAFPYYLRMRSDLSQNNAPHTINRKERSLNLTAITFAGIGYLTLAIAVPVDNSVARLPLCDETSIVLELRSMIAGAQKRLPENSRIVTIKDHSETINTIGSGFRSCASTLVSTSGETAILYQVHQPKESYDLPSIEVTGYGL
jgi:hypothetical protein